MLVYTEIADQLCSRLIEQRVHVHVAYAACIVWHIQCTNDTMYSRFKCYVLIMHNFITSKFVLNGDDLQPIMQLSRNSEQVFFSS